MAIIPVFVGFFTTKIIDYKKFSYQTETEFSYLKAEEV